MIGIGSLYIYPCCFCGIWTLCYELPTPATQGWNRADTGLFIKPVSRATLLSISQYRDRVNDIKNMVLTRPHVSFISSIQAHQCVVCTRKTLLPARSPKSSNYLATALAKNSQHALLTDTGWSIRYGRVDTLVRQKFLTEKLQTFIIKKSDRV